MSHAAALLITVEVGFDPAVLSLACLGLVGCHRFREVVALGGNALRGNIIFFHQVFLDAFSAPLGQFLVVCPAGHVVGMPGYFTTCLWIFCKEATQYIQVLGVIRLDVGLVGVEFDIYNGWLVAESFCCG